MEEACSLKIIVNEILKWRRERDEVGGAERGEGGEGRLL